MLPNAAALKSLWMRKARQEDERRREKPNPGQHVGSSNRHQSLVAVEAQEESQLSYANSMRQPASMVQQSPKTGELSSAQAYDMIAMWKLTHQSAKSNTLPSMVEHRNHNIPSPVEKPEQPAVDPDRTSTWITSVVTTEVKVENKMCRLSLLASNPSHQSMATKPPVTIDDRKDRDVGMKRKMHLDLLMDALTPRDYSHEIVRNALNHLALENQLVDMPRLSSCQRQQVSDTLRGTGLSVPTDSHQMIFEGSCPQRSRDAPARRHSIGGSLDASARRPSIGGSSSFASSVASSFASTASLLSVSSSCSASASFSNEMPAPSKVSEEACSTSCQTAPPSSKRSISKKKEPLKIYPRRKGGQPMRNAHQVLVTEEMLEKVRISHGIISKNIDHDGRSRGARTGARTELVSHRESCLVHCR